MTKLSDNPGNIAVLKFNSVIFHDNPKAVTYLNHSETRTERLLKYFKEINRI